MYSKSDRKVQFLRAILDCQVGQVKVDFQKLADKLGYKNVRSAADSYYRFRRGLDLGASSPRNGNSSARGSIRRKPRLHKRKVIYSDDDDDGEDGDEDEDEDSGGGSDAAGCEIKQERIEGDGSRVIKLEGDTEEAIFIKSESDGEDDGGVAGRNDRRRKSGEEGGGFSGFRGAGYCCASTSTRSGFEGTRFDGFGVSGGLPPPLVVVERALPEKAVEKGVVVIKDEPVDDERWVWK